MKLTAIIILLALFSSCATINNYDLSLTITHIQRDKKEIWARNGYSVWVARCDNISGSLKPGMKIKATPLNKTDPFDSCKCVFRRVK